ncbi:MAG: M42 family peptidase [Lachnospiraceae bacterium]|nr:M42 family peptidase [Lachnospiraceae bacterium]
MDKLQNLKMIGDISNANGAPGFEDEVVKVLRGYAEGLGELKEDSLRNFYIYRKENRGGRPVVQLDAHSDEVAFMVQAIKPNGTLQIIPLGGWVTSNIPAHKVWVRNADGEYIPGIVASKPPHYMTEAERKAPLEISSLSVDVGAVSMEDAVQNYHIRIGEPIVPDVTFRYDEAHDLMVGKSFDCRLGCAQILAALKELAGEELNVDLVGACASQEEVGTRGSVITSRVIHPDLAIVFEGCPADDTCVEPYMVQTAIKKGPMLRHIDARMITNPRYQRYALDMAAKKGIPVQDAVRSAGSTNGASIHLSGEGVPTIVIGIPVRYAHTHYGISSYADFENGVKLACEILRDMNEEKIKSF